LPKEAISNQKFLYNPKELFLIAHSRHPKPLIAIGIICFVDAQIPKSSDQRHLIRAIELIVISCKFLADRNAPGFQSQAQKNPTKSMDYP